MHIVFVEPEIPPNTGTTARLCAATNTSFHLVGPLGFSLEDRYLKRAGLDYWPLVDLKTYEEWDDFARAHHAAPMKFFSVHAAKSYLEADYNRGDFLIFGGETKGLGAEFLKDHVQHSYRIPIFEPRVRSLNLANAVSIVTY